MRTEGRTDGRPNGQQDEANNRLFAILRPRTRICYFSGGNVRHREIGTNPWSCAFTKDTFIKAECNFFATSYVKWPCDDLRATVRTVAARWSLQHPMQGQILTSKDFYHLEKMNYDGFSIAIKWHLIVVWIKIRHYGHKIEREHSDRSCLRMCYFIAGLWRKTQKCLLLLLRFLKREKWNEYKQW